MVFIRTFLFLIAVFNLNFSLAQDNVLYSVEGKFRNPHIPSKDSLESLCTFKLNELTRIVKSDTVTYDLYLKSGVRFNGWACQTWDNNAHKYRYVFIENGIILRQIGYFSNGNFDLDFHMKDGKSLGSSRMWSEDGNPYIDEYFIEPGLAHGIQKRWHANRVLARETFFEYGKMIYELLYNEAGNLIETKGKVPKGKTTDKK